MTPGNAAAPNAMNSTGRARRARQPMMAAGTSAASRRFGRVRIAALVSRPAPAAAARPSASATASAQAHHAVTGTSLETENNSNRNGGLAASSIDADTPASGPATRLPRTNVANTARPPRSGTTTNTAL